MQSIAKHGSQLLKSKLIANQKLLKFTAIVTSIGVGLIGIFALSDWAETAPFHHAIQHLLIFTAGLGLGGSLISSHKTKKGAKNEG